MTTPNGVVTVTQSTSNAVWKVTPGGSTVAYYVGAVPPGAVFLDGSGHVPIGEIPQSDANHNTRGAGTGVLTALTTGSQNTGLGYQALTAATTLSESTAVGFKALTSATTGGANTAVGNYALTDTTTGTSNTAVGDGALFHNTVNSDNTAVGNVALQFADATGNTAVGSLSLSQLTTGPTNTAFGYNTLASLTTGSTNTAVGVGAGTTPNGVAANASKAAQQAVMVGYGSGCSDTGDLGYFVAVGVNAVASFAGTAVGYGSAASSSRTVAVGYGATASSAGAVAIGCDHTGVGASTATTDEIKLGTANHTINTPTTPALGNGASTGLTALAKGTGGGPASAVVAQWIPWRNGALSGWVPFFQ